MLPADLRRGARTLLVLGRVSNLPTVWSNCLAGWWLGGGALTQNLIVAAVGSSFLYIGGMYLNDAFDADFDRQHRAERPIPSGAISLEAVSALGFAWLAIGFLLLAWLGVTVAVLGFLLACAIVLYDFLHKAIALSPLLMAACRFLLYLMAAAAGLNGIAGLAIYSAFALAAYIIGLSYLARRESARGALRYWPCGFLAAPIFLGLLVNNGPFRIRGSLLALLLLLWIWRCLRWTFLAPRANIGRTVSGLLAGIVLVDWLAAADVPAVLAMIFVGLFAAALLFQRFIPAT